LRRCEECGFDWDGTDSVDVIRAAAERYPRPLSRLLTGEDPDVVLRTRPEPRVWSALEYAGHVRDTLDFYCDRVERAVTEDRPQFGPLDHEALCEERRYNEEDAVRTAAGVTEAAVKLADYLDGLDDDQWDRVGLGTDGDERTVRELARRAAHESHHHLLDIGRVLRAVRQTLER
jgi:hypothetical protein